MFTCTFFITILISLTSSSILVDKQIPVTLKPKPIVRLATLQNDPPILQPRQITVTPTHPHITPRQGYSCKNINYTFTAPGQRAILLSVNYPGDYPSNTDCSYLITSPAKTKMTLECPVFNIACDKDYFSFSLKGDGSDTQYFCGPGGSKLSLQTTLGNRLPIGFHSSAVQPATNYWYRYNCTITVSNILTPTAAPTPAPTPSLSPAGSCSCGVRNTNGATRIVGGVQTNTGEIPWRVAVFITDGSGSGFLCGGTIISKNWIMTAGHCTMNIKSSDTITIYTGAQANPVTVGGSGTAYAIDRYVQNPNFDRTTLNNDMTLLHLKTPITFTNTVSPACLPWSLVNFNLSGASVLASGWGTINPVAEGVDNNDPPSQTLNKVTLPLLTTSQCQNIMGNAVTDNMLCTYKSGYDTCQGDSGGSIDYLPTSSSSPNSPYYAIGVVSFGYGCAQTNDPGVYTKVTNYLSWIQTTTGETFCRK